MEEDKEMQWRFDDYDWVDRYDEVVAADSKLYARYEEVLETVAELAVPAPGKRILDIGAGTGTLAAMCVQHGAEVIGLDPSERMLAQARAKFTRNEPVKLILTPAPFLCIPFRRSSFDAVVAAVHEMLRALRPGGTWALGDLAFESASAEAEALSEFPWLEEEYFARIDELRPVFADAGMSLNAKQFTPVTWVVWARKPPLTGE
ncbi:MAG: class I SAM-dependent methyltransferase [Planctomycetota bacterium]|jgi:ubiquinone/menaquinone biosynthesis C-methylase UbiE